MKSFVHVFLESVAKLLSGKISGRVIGLVLIAVPLVFLVRSLLVTGGAWLELILLIPIMYAGLFLGGFLHEVGHVITLRAIGGRSKIIILRNHHSKWLFFNMKTEITNDHPTFSTKYKLIIRAMSGMLSNIVFMFFFLGLGLVFKSHLLLFLSVIQGFSGHGATTLSKLEGDTDVFTLYRALQWEDRISAELVGNIQEEGEGGSQGVGDVQLHIELKNPDNEYWLLLQEAGLIDFTGDFYSFDLGDENLFVQARNGATEFDLSIKLTNPESMKIVSKSGTMVKIA